jgi:hypothetical protein
MKLGMELLFGAEILELPLKKRCTAVFASLPARFSRRQLVARRRSSGSDRKVGVYVRPVMMTSGL